RRPSYYFGSGQEQLGHLTDSYLRLLGEAGVITAALRDAALQARPLVRQEGERARGEDYTTRKAATLVRTQLASLLDTPRLYDLDRLDLRVASSIDAPLQNAVTDLLRRLRRPQLRELRARRQPPPADGQRGLAGLDQPRLHSPDARRRLSPHVRRAGGCSANPRRPGEPAARGAAGALCRARGQYLH